MQNRLQNILDNIQLSEQDSERIIKDCMKEKHVSNKLFLYSGRIAAAIVVVILATTSATAYAAVSAYQAYMESMSAEEVQERYENVNEGKRGWTLYSRDLTQEEERRMDVLQEAYWAGTRFPEASMPYFDGENEEKPREASISFDYVNETCYLPERELTDEELLQIIDLYEKADYSLQYVGKETSGEIDLQESGLQAPVITPKPVSPQDFDMTEPEARTEEENIGMLAKEACTLLTGCEATTLVWTIELRGDLEEDVEKWYLVTFEETEARGNICLNFDDALQEWKITRYTRLASQETDAVQVTFTEEESREQVAMICEDAVKMLVEAFGVIDPIIKGEHDYGYNSKLLQVVLTTENGNRYRLYYNFVTGQVRDYSIYTAEKWEKYPVLDAAYVTEFEVGQ